MPTPTPIIPKGSLVLVTGLTGFVGSHVGKVFLERGYKVRGTVRNLAAASWLSNGLFKPYAESGDLELVEVPDLAVENAFDDAVRGVSAVIHVATVIPESTDPNEVVPQTVAGTTSILYSALKEPSVRSFVYTGSIASQAMQSPQNTEHVVRDSWNELSVKLAYAPPPHPPSQPFIVYMASKVKAEQALWKFVSEKQPQFSVNVVSPACILGQPLHKKHTGKAGEWIKVLYDGDSNIWNTQPAGYIIDVKDVALLHFAAAVDPDAKNARISAWGHTENASWNDVLAIMRKIRPNKEFMPDHETRLQLQLTTDQSQAIALLKKWGDEKNNGGYRPLADTVEEGVRGAEEKEI